MASEQRQFRACGASLAFLLALMAAWILLPETVRPDARADAATRRSSIAAILSWPRGDLAADRVLADSDANVQGRALQDSASLEKQIAAAERAAVLAPYDSRVWLLLAGLTSQDSGKALWHLKMSYYTSSNDPSLYVQRIKIASAVAQSGDDELPILIEGDIRNVVLRNPDMKPALVDAFRSASPEGKFILQSSVERQDPAFSAALKNR